MSSTITIYNSNTVNINNKNKNNNTLDNVYGAVIMTQVIAISSGSFGECRTVLNLGLAVNPLIGCYHLHPPFPFIIVLFSQKAGTFLPPEG